MPLIKKILRKALQGPFPAKETFRNCHNNAVYIFKIFSIIIVLRRCDLSIRLEKRAVSNLKKN